MAEITGDLEEARKEKKPAGGQAEKEQRKNPGSAAPWRRSSPHRSGGPRTGLPPLAEAADDGPGRRNEGQPHAFIRRSRLRSRLGLPAYRMLRRVDLSRLKTRPRDDGGRFAETACGRDGRSPHLRNGTGESRHHQQPDERQEMGKAALGSCRHRRLEPPRGDETRATGAGPAFDLAPSLSTKWRKRRRIRLHHPRADIARPAPRPCRRGRKGSR